MINKNDLQMEKCSTSRRIRMNEKRFLKLRTAHEESTVIDHVAGSCQIKRRRLRSARHRRFRLERRRTDDGLLRIASRDFAGFPTTNWTSGTHVGREKNLFANFVQRPRTDKPVRRQKSVIDEMKKKYVKKG